MGPMQFLNLSLIVWELQILMGQTRKRTNINLFNCHMKSSNCQTNATFTNQEPYFGSYEPLRLYLVSSGALFNVQDPYWKEIVNIQNISKLNFQNIWTEIRSTRCYKYDFCDGWCMKIYTTDFIWTTKSGCHSCQHPWVASRVLY